MNKKDLIRTNSTEIAHQICNRIQTNNDRNKKPFVPGWEDVTKDMPELIDNIEELYKHPRKYKALIHYLNMFMESEMN